MVATRNIEGQATRYLYMYIGFQGIMYVERI